MKLLRALFVFVFAVIFAGVLTAIATNAFPPIDGKPQNQILIPIAIVTFLIGWVFAAAFVRQVWR